MAYAKQLLLPMYVTTLETNLYRNIIFIYFFYYTSPILIPCAACVRNIICFYEKSTFIRLLNQNSRKPSANSSEFPFSKSTYVPSDF